ncbi:MAG: hypothetical protein NZ959_09805 [Armatimonadetes bacterium]|nr:hypothetical protein [Armatimonadota bacterium]MDW8122654.1 hypothetical protein [Armatimonadota bacterium]
MEEGKENEGLWFQKVLVGIEFGPTGANEQDTVYFSRASGADIVRSALLARCEYIVLFCKDQNFAYYNSRVAKKCPNLGDRDLLQECLEDATRHGLPVIAYVQVQYDTSSWLAHPEWRMRDLTGKEIFARLCFRSGYWNFIASVVDELMEYPISGFHIDMLDFGFVAPYGCACPVCAKEFEAESGRPIPQEPTWDDGWDQFLNFRYRSNRGFCNRLVEHIRSRRPDLSVDFNYHGYPPFSWFSGQKPVAHGDYGDFITAEGLPWIFGHTNPSLLSLFMQGVRPKGFRQGVTSRGVFDYHDFTVRPESEIRWEVFTYLAHGSFCTIVDKAYYDGSIEPVAFERVGRVFREAQEKREYFGHRPIQRVGIYFSQRTRDWWGRMEPQRYFSCVMGAHKALMESHIPCGFVFDESVSLNRLKEFPIVYLPNAAILSKREINLLTQYVADGGKLLITGLTGCYSNRGQPLPNSSLTHLTGARLHRLLTEHSDNYIRFSKGLSGVAAALSKDVPSDWCLLTYGPIAIYEPDGAEAFGELLIAHRSKDNPWQYHMSADRVVSPAFFYNRVGQGSVLLIPVCLDGAYIGPYRQPEHRVLIRNAIALLDPHPLVEVEAPLNVETVLTADEQKKCLYIHLLAFWGTIPATASPFPEGRRILPPIMEQELPYRAVLRFALAVREVRALDQRTLLEKDGHNIVVTVMGAHEVVVVQV